MPYDWLESSHYSLEIYRSFFVFKCCYLKEIPLSFHSKIIVCAQNDRSEQHSRHISKKSIAITTRTKPKQKKSSTYLWLSSASWPLRVVRRVVVVVSVSAFATFSIPTHTHRERFEGVVVVWLWVVGGWAGGRVAGGVWGEAKHQRESETCVCVCACTRTAGRCMHGSHSIGETKSQIKFGRGGGGRWRGQRVCRRKTKKKQQFDVKHRSQQRNSNRTNWTT